MIEILTGVIGFVAGASVVYFATRARSKSFNSPGYVMLRRELFPKKGQNGSYSSPKQEIYREYSDSQEKSQEQDDSPKLPDWF